MPERAPTG
jgi:DNA replication licensing factor MCM3